MQEGRTDDQPASRTDKHDKYTDSYVTHMDPIWIHVNSPIKEIRPTKLSITKSR